MGVAEGLNKLGKDYYSFLKEEYVVKRNKICGTLSNAGLMPYIPQGAYYVLADISRLPGNDSKEKVMYLLKEAGVAAVPGGAFYHDNS